MALSNSSRTAAHDLEETIRENIFSRPTIYPHVSSLEERGDSKLLELSEENLLAARERIQEFRSGMPKPPYLTSSQEDAKKDDSMISPFQITPKPPGEQ